MLGIKSPNDNTLFGFILREGKPDLFVHFSAIQSDGFKTLNQDDEVTYEVVSGDKGEQASNVSVTKAAPRKRRGRKASDDLED